MHVRDPATGGLDYSFISLCRWVPLAEHEYDNCTSYDQLGANAMAEPFLSEIRIMSFSFAPKGWALCDGQILPINQNQALFSLLGTTYGGDGRVTFALPDLRGRTAVHTGDGLAFGERGGETAHTLTITEIPAHTHVVN